MADWYAHMNMTQVGPMPLASLQELLASGKLRPADPVWTEGWPQWRSAGEVAELTGSGLSPAAGSPLAAEESGSPAAQVGLAAPPVAGGLEYRSAPSGTVSVTERALAALGRTRPWVMLWAVLLFIGAALSALGAAAMLLIGAMDGEFADEPIFMIVLALLYLVMGVTYFFAGFYLTRYFVAIGTTTRLRRPEDLEAAIVAQMKFWRVTGIVLVALIVIYVIVIAAAFVWAALF